MLSKLTLALKMRKEDAVVWPMLQFSREDRERNNTTVGYHKIFLLAPSNDGGAVGKGAQCPKKLTSCREH
jgi:hypothetical protein